MGKPPSSKSQSDIQIDILVDALEKHLNDYKRLKEDLERRISELEEEAKERKSP